MATRTENPIEGMYKIRSAMTKPTLMMPLAGRNGTMSRDRAIRIFLENKIQINKWTENIFKPNELFPES